jgi:hypothetical protein
MGERVKSLSEGEESSQDTHHTNPDKNAEQKLPRETVVSMLYEAMVAHDSRNDKIIQEPINRDIDRRINRNPRSMTKQYRVYSPRRRGT